SQLKGWKDGKRTNDPLHLMTGIASKLNDDQVAAVAAWIGIESRSTKQQSTTGRMRLVRAIRQSRGRNDRAETVSIGVVLGKPGYSGYRTILLAALTHSVGATNLTGPTAPDSA
nr:hypothetical protein [Bradyrhizobium sp.]